MGVVNGQPSTDIRIDGLELLKRGVGVRSPPEAGFELSKSLERKAPGYHGGVHRGSRRKSNISRISPAAIRLTRRSPKLGQFGRSMHWARLLSVWVRSPGTSAITSPGDADNRTAKINMRSISASGSILRTAAAQEDHAGAGNGTQQGIGGDARDDPVGVAASLVL